MDRIPSMPAAGSHLTSAARPTSHSEKENKREQIDNEDLNLARTRRRLREVPHDRDTQGLFSEPKKASAWRELSPVENLLIDEEANFDGCSDISLGDDTTPAPVLSGEASALNPETHRHILRDAPRNPNIQSLFSAAGANISMPVASAVLRAPSPVVDNPLLIDKKANQCDRLSGVDNRAPSPAAGSEANEFVAETPLYSNELCSPIVDSPLTDEGISEYDKFHDHSQRAVSSSPPPSIAYEEIFSSIGSDYIAEDINENLSTSGLIKIQNNRGQGALASFDEQWVIYPDLENDNRYRLTNKINKNDIYLEFCSSPAQEFGANNPIFLFRAQEKWLAYVEKDKIHLYALKNSGWVEKKIEYAINNITALNISTDGRYFSVANTDGETSAIFIWKITKLDELPEKIICSEAHGAKIKNIIFHDKEWAVIAFVSDRNKYTIQIFPIEPIASRNYLYSKEIKMPAAIDKIIPEKTEEGLFLIIWSGGESYKLNLPSSLGATSINKSRVILAEDSLDAAQIRDFV